MSHQKGFGWTGLDECKENGMVKRIINRTALFNFNLYSKFSQRNDKTDRRCTQFANSACKLHIAQKVNGYPYAPANTFWHFPKGQNNFKICDKRQSITFPKFMLKESKGPLITYRNFFMESELFENYSTNQQKFQV